jgi:hypothetical protein
VKENFKRKSGISEGNLWERDIRELEALRRQALLRVLATTNLAYMAPYLSLARTMDVKMSAGSKVTIQIQAGDTLPQEGYIVVYLRTSTSIDALTHKKNIENVLYTFRNLSSQAFEPFVNISRTDDYQEVFAYSNDDEFLIEKIDGDDKTVLREMKKMAVEKRMHSLVRFIDLIERAVDRASDKRE